MSELKIPQHPKCPHCHDFADVIIDQMINSKVHTTVAFHGMAIAAASIVVEWHYKNNIDIKRASDKFAELFATAMGHMIAEEMASRHD